VLETVEESLHPVAELVACSIVSGDVCALVCATEFEGMIAIAVSPHPVEHADYDSAGQFRDLVACVGLRTTRAGPLHPLLHPRGDPTATWKVISAWPHLNGGVRSALLVVANGSSSND
jgi:hypothetical protein